MNLEIGKTYVTREGSIVEPLGRFDPTRDEPIGHFICKVTHFDGQTVELYDPDGTHSTDGLGGQDVIEEV